MKIYEIIKPLGILAYVALMFAFFTGVAKFKFHVRWINIKWHIWLGVIAVVLASIHAIIVIYVNM